MSRHTADLGSRIAPLLEKKRAELGWSEQELGRRAGVTQPTVHRILNAEGKNPRMTNIERLAGALGLNVAELLNLQTTDLDASKAFNNVSTGPLIKGRVPLISWVTAGELCESAEYFAPGTAEEWLDCPYPHDPGSFCLKVVGDSMFPEYREGELILVDPTLEARHGDDIVVRTPEGKTTFKRLQSTSDGAFLIALNKDFPNRIIEVPADTAICGVVVASWTNRRRR